MLSFRAFSFIGHLRPCKFTARFIILSKLIAHDFRSCAAVYSGDGLARVRKSGPSTTFRTDAPCSLDGPPSIRQNIRTPAIQTGRRRIELRTGAFYRSLVVCAGNLSAPSVLSTLRTVYEIFGSGVIRFNATLAPRYDPRQSTRELEMASAAV